MEEKRLMNFISEKNGPQLPLVALGTKKKAAKEMAGKVDKKERI